MNPGPPESVPGILQNSRVDPFNLVKDPVNLTTERNWQYNQTAVRCDIIPRVMR